MERIRGQLQDHKDILEKLIVDLASQRAQLDETTSIKAQRGEELRESEERLEKSKERLMNVSSAKEYNALEKEMEQLRRMTEETREQLDHLKEAIDVNERSIAEKEEKISDLKAQIDGAEAEAEGLLDKLQSKLKNIRSKRNTAAKKIEVHILRRYDFIRNRRGGTAIVQARNGHCEGCFMRLPPQMAIEVQRGNTLIACPSCQRILYYTPEEGDE
jgi:hypothetical protein